MNSAHANHPHHAAMASGWVARAAVSGTASRISRLDLPTRRGKLR